jgi:prepilin-type processing-associated H-X9-DG protein
MKVYAAPEHIALPETNWSNYNRKEEEKKEEAYIQSIKEWAIAEGFNGPRTGEIYSTPMADGYANYVFCDGGRKSFLVHLKFHDGWHSRDVEFLPKSEILKRIDQRKNMAKLFGSS